MMSSVKEKSSLPLHEGGGRKTKKNEKKMN